MGQDEEEEKASGGGGGGEGGEGREALFATEGKRLQVELTAGAPRDTSRRRASVTLARIPVLYVAALLTCTQLCVC